MNEQQLFCGVFLTISSALFATASYQLVKLNKENPQAFYRLDMQPNYSFAPHRDVPKKLDKRGLKKDVSSTVNEFLAVMKRENFDTSKLFQNFNPANIELRKGKDIGTYNRESQKLIVDPENVRPTLLRALLAMNTTYSYEPGNFKGLGFERTTYYKPIAKSSKIYVRTFGMGLNEGYKDVFLNRYFDLHYKYEELADLATMIEIAIGQKEMEKYFLTGNLGEFALKMSTVYRAHLEDTYWAMGKQTIYKMDKLYQKIYFQGVIGSWLSTASFSDFFTIMATLATSVTERNYRKSFLETAERCFHPGNDHFWESSPETYARLAYLENHELYTKTIQNLKAIKNLVTKYRNSDSLKPGLTSADCEKLRETRKSYTILPIHIIKGE